MYFVTERYYLILGAFNVNFFMLLFFHATGLLKETHAENKCQKA